MKLVHTSDIHVDENNRFEETEELLNWMAKDICSYEPDAIFVAGDSAPVGVRPMTPKERNTLGTWYRWLATAAPVYICKGNHDFADGDVDMFGSLHAAHEIRVFTRPEVITTSAAIIAALPWPSKGWLAQLAADSKAAIDERCRLAMNGILLGMSVDIQERVFRAQRDRPVIFMGHLNVEHSDIGGFSLIGTDVEVSVDSLEMLEADYYALGHIHKRQNFGPRIWYSGSPRRVDAGEEGETKGYLQVELQPGRCRVEFRPTPIPEMQTIRLDFTHGSPCIGPVHAGADVRIIVTIPEEKRAAFDETGMLELLLVDQALRYKVEYKVISKQRVRSVAMQEAKTDADRLKAYLSTLEPAPELAVVDRLLRKLELVS